MDCPREQREMEHQGYWKYARHACPACRGIFVLENDVMEKLGAAGGDLEAVAEVKLDNVHDSKLACPKDGTTMKAVRLGSAEIDVCAACHGLWLDRGEYEKIIASMRERGDAMRSNPKPPMHGVARAAAAPSANVDGVLELLGGVLSSALIWARIMGRNANSGVAAAPREIEIPDPIPNPNCRR